MYLTIRKTKVKRDHASGCQQDVKHDVGALEIENLSLKSCIHDLEEKLDAYENIMEKFEGKVASLTLGRTPVS